MKTIASVSVLALLLVSIATPWSMNARSSGPSASGNYRFTEGDGPTKQVEFEARDDSGTITGLLTFRDESTVVDQDPDQPEERPADPPPAFFLTADLDSLTVEHNRAVIGGTVRESSHGSYVGRWVQLVIEDNQEADKVSWRVCQVEPGGWIPVDAEDPRDQGAFLQWWATDAEREDDRGIQSPNVNPGLSRGCPAVSLSTYDFPETRGEGQIQILQ